MTKPMTCFRLIVCVLSVRLSTCFAQKRLTVEDIYGTDTFNTKTLGDIQWTPDGKAFTYVDQDETTEKITLKRYDLESGERTNLMDSETVDILQDVRYEKRFPIPNYIWSPTGRHILLPSGNDLFLYDVKNKKVRRLTDDAESERDPRFSPDGKKIVYLKKNNLHLLNIATRDEIRLTEQGTVDLLVGRFDWVYEEEFHIRTGFVWSSDSRHIAYFESDQSVEPEFPIVDFIPLYNEAPTMRYPKAGEPNAVVRIGVVPAEGGETIWMDIGQETDIYIPRIHWLNDSKRLAIQRLNRDQNRLDLLLADAETGTSRIILTEEDPHGSVNATDDVIFLKDDRHFIWPSERSNWNHLYLYDLEGNRVRQITAGHWDVTQVVHVDEKRKTVYFIGTEKSSIERHLYRVGLDGQGCQKLTREDGTHRINVSPDGRVYLEVFSNVTTPPRTTLYRNDGQKIRVVEPGEIPALKEYELSAPEFFTLKTDDDLDLNAYLFKPVDFDPQKKYPVLIYTYGCIGSQIVQNDWRGGQGDLWHQMMLQKGYLVFGVDNRGTGFKGNDFKNLTYRNMGVGLVDQIAGAEYLRSLTYVDGHRIGIWGWSGGGWMTCLAMTKGGGAFKTGVAVASVTDWRNYDTIWTEMRMDQPQDNETGYAESNPLNYIDNYQGGLFLIHGTADDNVHMSNTMQLVYALQNARKPFDLMIYPQKRHGIRGQDTRVHLFNKITEFILNNL